MSKKASHDVKQLRAIGHKLRPVVTIAGKGLTENVVAEIDRALKDHEFIKIKLAVGGRDERLAVSEALCQRTGAEVVQSVGNIILVLRRSPQPDPKLSNLIRTVA
jgi:RNA-binding protein